jgi:predicted nucleic acid-binding protein
MKHSRARTPRLSAFARKVGDVLLPDVNVLICAHRAEAVDHDRYREWLEALVASPAPFALSELVAVGFVRVVTNRRIWAAPTPPTVATDFIPALRVRHPLAAT